MEGLVRTAQFSPLCTFIQIMTAAETGDNVFIYRLEDSGSPVFAC